MHFLDVEVWKLQWQHWVYAVATTSPQPRSPNQALEVTKSSKMEPGARSGGGFQVHSPKQQTKCFLTFCGVVIYLCWIHFFGMMQAKLYMSASSMTSMFVHHPGGGISSYAGQAGAAGRSLEVCLDQAVKAVPSERHPLTPVYLGATAGMRLLQWVTVGFH